ncbi:MAG: gamma-glutamyltransferase family protein [Alphaproteobacteria bacterium]|nr:MAG: gamma-glutamyltransferase family protein [Alphaproteobacteria bacterium]
MPDGRTVVRARHHVIAAGHDLATQAGLEILEAGGNAVDAGVAAGIALAVVHSDLVNFAGVAPIMIHMATTGETVTIDGLGVWPKAASVAFFEREYGGAIPEGLLRTVVPAAPAAWIAALARFGTMRFGEVAHHAVRYAREGFPVYPLFAQFIMDNEAAYRRTPANARIYLPDGRPPRVGETFVQSDLAATIQYMIDEERAAGGDRRSGLKAARDAFYRGDIAARICDYHIAHGGFLRRDDMAHYDVRFEPPLRIRVGDTELLTCGPWCQGITLAQAFRMLNGINIAALGHNSADYVHALTEVFKLAFADREAHVADPAVVDVPTSGLLDPAYLAARRRLIDPARAFPEMPPAGDPWTGAALAAGPSQVAAPRTATSATDPHDTVPRDSRPRAMNAEPGWRVSDPPSADTSHVAVIDKAGNMFSATPSDTSADTEVIPGTGLCPSSRGSQSYGIGHSLNALAPGKRPRMTPNPAMALQGGEPFLAFGTPGGDVQIQALVQVYMNARVFAMDLQSAVEAPRFATYSFPSSFAPNAYHPGLLMIEEGIPDDVFDDLRARGHDAQRWPARIWKAGGVLMVQRDAQTGGLIAGADPRRAGTARGR